MIMYGRNFPMGFFKVLKIEIELINWNNKLIFNLIFFFLFNSKTHYSHEHDQQIPYDASYNH